MSQPCAPCGGNVNYTVPQPSSVQPGGGDVDAPTTPTLSECPVHFIETSEDFDFPAPGETSIIRSCCSEGIAPGAILYSLGIGYLHVESIPNECEIEVGNHGETCNVKVPGEPVASGTKLQIGIPTCGGNNSAQDGVICLTTDFFVPDYCAAPTDTGGCCRNVGVTSVAGLTVGDRLALGSREFRLAEIVSASVIRICNDGAGGLPGAVVYAMDDCFSIIGGANICERETVDGGLLLACRDGQQAPIAGTYDGQIPQWDNSLNRFVLVAAPPLPTCTSLDADFTVDETNPPETNYIIDVFDSSNFIVGGSLQINESGGNLRRFSIITIIDGTHLRVHPLFTVTTNTTFHAGASVCYVEDRCSFTAQDANVPVIGAVIGCVDGISTPLTPSADNKILVGKDDGGMRWTEENRGLGFFPVMTTCLNITNTTSIQSMSFDTIGIPGKIGNQQIYLRINIWAELSGPSGVQVEVRVNGVGLRTLHTNGNGTTPPGGGADEDRFSWLVPAAGGGTFTAQMATIQNLSGGAITTRLTILAEGFLA